MRSGASHLARSASLNNPAPVDVAVGRRCSFLAQSNLTVIDGALQGVIQNQESKGSTVVLNPQGGQQVVDDILRNSVNIPPTINVNQGTRVQVIVAKDVDFRSVYELRTAALQ